ncbi:MAG: TetR/AcrR family transcriptional regulator [Crocinitomicaceae bacterium]
MPKKAELTSAYIIQKVAPVFNKKGYSATSMADITLATGLTKGAIYGNFLNKNELAIKSFSYNINLITNAIAIEIEKEKSAINKLLAITKFYSKYYQFTLDFGGCPVLNIGVDANHQDPVLMQKVQKAIGNVQKFIESVIESGIANNEIKQSIDSKYYARQIFARIEGAVFMTMTTKKEIYMKDMVKGLNHMIEKDIAL